jgi:DNA uptake protein and related DNA-binding proteins
MKSFFRFTAGEWAASALIGLLLLAGILFYFLYENNSVAHAGSAEYQELSYKFELEQQRLKDSMKAAHTKDYRITGLRNEKGTGLQGYTPRTGRDPSYRYDKSKAFSGDSLKKQPQKPQYTIVKVELNRADTSDIMRIPQFGSKRAQKIVEYRDKLGGFYSLAQLQEIYILQNINLEYVDKYFTADRKLIRKININQCDYKTLVSHPYFDSYLTKTILNYRQKNGPIRDMSQLRDITHIYAELEEKLQWYIEF